MIHYNLRCERGHAFESWFQSSAAYETQEKRKLVNCPVCGSAKVERAIMAPQIVGKKARDSAEAPPAALPVPAEATTPTSTPLVPRPPWSWSEQVQLPRFRDSSC